MHIDQFVSNKSVKRFIKKEYYNNPEKLWSDPKKGFSLTVTASVLIENHHQTVTLTSWWKLGLLTTRLVTRLIGKVMEKRCHKGIYATKLYAEEKPYSIAKWKRKIHVVSKCHLKHVWVKVQWQIISLRLNMSSIGRGQRWLTGRVIRQRSYPDQPVS